MYVMGAAVVLRTSPSDRLRDLRHVPPYLLGLWVSGSPLYRLCIVSNESLFLFWIWLWIRLRYSPESALGVRTYRFRRTNQTVRADAATDPAPVEQRAGPSGHIPCWIPHDNGEVPHEG